jgi:thiamine biosynthesis lipoprotein
VGIAHDHATSEDEVSACVALSAGGLATSGTRVRRWETAAGRLHHILDPRTGRPAAGPWEVVTVAAATCADANAATTAAIVLGDDAPRWLASHRLPARLGDQKGEVVLVGGWPVAA